MANLADILKVVQDERFTGRARGATVRVRVVHVPQGIRVHVPSGCMEVAEGRNEEIEVVLDDLKGMLDCAACKRWEIDLEYGAETWVALGAHMKSNLISRSGGRGAIYSEMLSNQLLKAVTVGQLISAMDPEDVGSLRELNAETLDRSVAALREIYGGCSEEGSIAVAIDVHKLGSHAAAGEWIGLAIGSGGELRVGSNVVGVLSTLAMGDGMGEAAVLLSRHGDLASLDVALRLGGDSLVHIAEVWDSARRSLSPVQV